MENSALNSTQAGTYPNAGAGQNGKRYAWTWYDSFGLLDTGLLEHPFFTVPVGQGGKTLADTNFPAAGVMPNGFKHTTYEIGVAYWPHAAYTQANFIAILAFIRQLIFSVQIQNLPLQGQWSGLELFGLTMPLVILGGAVGDQVLGRNVIAGGKTLAEPITLAAQTNFSIPVNQTAASAAAFNTDRVYVFLKGIAETV